MKNYIIFLVALFGVLGAQAQTRVSGKVTDAVTGEALPFVSIYIKNTSLGTTTDDTGIYSLRLATIPDSITVSFMGYITQSKAISKGTPSQVIDFQLRTNALNLQEIVIRPTENPAFRIMREVVAHKKENDKRKLMAYNYEAYTKMQFEVDNLAPKKVHKVGLRSALSSMVDSSMYIAGEDGKKMLPFFMSESLSDFYYNRDPKKTKEIIKASKVSGIGIQDGSLVTQVIGSNHQDYNFYMNWVSVLQKNFVSPIADGWKGYYEYELLDSLYVGNNWCYKIKVDQKRKQDLAFNGHIWIAADSYALRKIDVTISKSANINLVESVHLVQELLPVGQGAWIPAKTMATMKIAKLSEKRPGIVAKVTTSSKDVQVNNEKESSFFQQSIEVTAKANADTKLFWEEKRHDTLTVSDQQAYALIDSIRSSPKVERLTNLVTVLATGYKKVGKVSLGAYPYTYAYNNIEGHRFQAGLKTNINFSDKWELSGYTAYGTEDECLKYRASARYIFSRKHWSEMGVSRSEDLQQVALLSDRLNSSPFYVGFSRFGELEMPMLIKESNFYLQRDLIRGVTQRIAISNKVFQPQYDFGYYTSGKEQPLNIAKDFNTTELTYSARIAKNEVFVQNDNERISLGNGSWPVLTFKYTLGLNNVIGSSFEYQRADVGISQEFVMGSLGNANYRIDAGKIFSAVPYPLLEVHLGNETPFYYDQTYQLMDNFEFASDSYASLHYEQFFEGLLMNRLPLIKKLKWRTLATANVLYGNLSEKNLSILSPTGANGTPQQTFMTLGSKPYVEVGYGIENIFKVLRVDAFHRLTYLNQPVTRKFGLKFSVQFKL
ncbi:DUF5686 and carboxypeptidase-like regulatory domain-containing protein [Pontibacter harenae]|uniref:DUF5686 and carboxypeptidase-like regulatory domain-containing protein n=1 Tax=Pontibacter harenae TaxID=2894083 RepID=UPI001E5476AD|nr:DUF5686 and carboxypeptidase-like regulatory domain-containing protein [Pontibacter harenae]MCC9165588.1 DUF5686 and carboxypeptidase regulatory-like domain-containing protein [Pontibacter harenae]